MDSNKKRLNRIARTLKPMQEELLTVTMTNGSIKRLTAPDVVLLLIGDNAITKVTGCGSKNNGKLVELICGLIPAPEVEL